MAAFRRSGGASTTATQQANNNGYASAGLTEVDTRSNSSSSIRKNGAFAFISCPLPQGVNIRSATLRWYWNLTGSNVTGARFTLRAHKVAAPPALKTTAGSGTNDINTRLSARTTESISVDFAGKPSVSLTSYDVTAMVQEVVDQASWASGNNLVFIIESASTVSYVSKFWGAENTNESLHPELYVEYGDVGSDPVVFDLVSVGDSHAVCATHSGYAVQNVSLATTGWTGTIAETYAGMVDDSTFGGTTLFGAGDQKRGYYPGGLLQKVLATKYGDDGVILTRGEYALGGTTLATWAADAPKTDGTGMWDGSGLNDRLATPSSSKQLVWLSLMGNDIRDAAGSAGSTKLISPRGSMWDTLRATMQTNLETCIDHILGIWDDNNVDGCIVLPAYHNFTVFGNDPAWYHYIPDTGSQPIERFVWGTSGFGFYAQTDYDCVTSSVRGGTKDDQSTYIRLAAERQISVYGAWNTSNSTQWNTVLSWAATTPLGDPNNGGSRTWVRSPGGGFPASQDGWRDGFRNITDVTVNTYMVGETQAVIEAAIAANPSWAERVVPIFEPQANGVDTTRSADSSSIYAQADWDDWVGQTDGIHGTSAFFEGWLTAIADRMDSEVWFMPGYGGTWPGPQALILE